MKIFLFTGLSASGKSTLSKRVGEIMDIPRVDLHKTIHHMAKKQGFSRARDWIASLGEENALHQSTLELIKQVEGQKNNRGLIIDEVLNIPTLEELKSSFPDDDFQIVYIRANRHDRKRFMKNRIEATNFSQAKEEINFIDRLKIKVGINDIIKIADYRFENFANIETVSQEIAHSLHQEINQNPEGIRRHPEKE